MSLHPVMPILCGALWQLLKSITYPQKAEPGSSFSSTPALTPDFNTMADCHLRLLRRERRVLQPIE